MSVERKGESFEMQYVYKETADTCQKIVYHVFVTYLCKKNLKNVSKLKKKSVQESNFRVSFAQLEHALVEKIFNS